MFAPVLHVCREGGPDPALHRAGARCARPCYNHSIGKLQICHTLPERSVGTSFWRPKIRVVVARAGANLVRIKGFLAISKCAFACALLAHFAVFATYALPKVASRAQNRCFAPY